MRAALMVAFCCGCAGGETAQQAADAGAGDGGGAGDDGGSSCAPPLLACGGRCVKPCPEGWLLDGTCECRSQCPDGMVFEDGLCVDPGADSDSDSDTDTGTATDSDTDPGTDSASDTGPEEDLYDPDNLCVAAVGGGAAFCGVDCEDDGVCPAGFACTRIVGGGGPSEMCAPADGDCAGEDAPTPLCDPCATNDDCR